MSKYCIVDEQSAFSVPHRCQSGVGVFKYNWYRLRRLWIYSHNLYVLFFVLMHIFFFGEIRMNEFNLNSHAFKRGENKMICVELRAICLKETDEN